jgi:hypothetical protein
MRTAGTRPQVTEPDLSRGYASQGNSCQPPMETAQVGQVRCRCSCMSIPGGCDDGCAGTTPGTSPPHHRPALGILGRRTPGRRAAPPETSCRAVRAFVRCSARQGVGARSGRPEGQGQGGPGYRSRHRIPGNSSHLGMDQARRRSVDLGLLPGRHRPDTGLEAAHEPA